MKNWKKKEQVKQVVPIELPKEEPKTIIPLATVYTEAELASFHAEIAKRGFLDSKKLFYKAIQKNPEVLTPEEVRALIFRMGFLSDTERYKFRNILVLENLTTEEESRFRKLYNKQLFEKYFPHKDKVEEHYKINFLAGR